MIGVGYFFYSLSDMQSSIQSKTSRKMRHYLEASSFIEKKSLKLSQKTQSSLSMTLWQYQSEFVNSLNHKQQSIHLHLKDLAEHEKEINRFNSLLEQSELLSKQVHSITI